MFQKQNKLFEGVAQSIEVKFTEVRNGMIIRPAILYKLSRACSE
jgi:hypothetical protein